MHLRQSHQIAACVINYGCTAELRWQLSAARGESSNIVETQEPQEDYYSVRIVNLIDDGPVSDPGHPIAPDCSSRVVPVMFGVRGELDHPSVDSFGKDGIPTDDLVDVLLEDPLSSDAVLAHPLHPIPYAGLLRLGLSDKFRNLA